VEQLGRAGAGWLAAGSTRAGFADRLRTGRAGREHRKEQTPWGTIERWERRDRWRFDQAHRPAAARHGTRPVPEAAASTRSGRNSRLPSPPPVSPPSRSREVEGTPTGTRLRRSAGVVWQLAGDRPLPAVPLAPMHRRDPDSVASSPTQRSHHRRAEEWGTGMQN